MAGTSSKYEEKIGRLEDELRSKKENFAKFVFNYVEKKYGVEGGKGQKSRDTVLEAMESVYENWDKI